MKKRKNFFKAILHYAKRVGRFFDIMKAGSLYYQVDLGGKK